ncbi:hypothetical protein Ancab_015571 [Ancistrocladus abbreviatus]
MFRLRRYSIKSSEVVEWREINDIRFFSDAAAYSRSRQVANSEQMIPLAFNLSAHASVFFSPSTLPKFKPTPSTHPRRKLGRQIGRGICKAELSTDAPFAIAIGACMLSSLLLPDKLKNEEGESDDVVTATDARFAVMGIVSFIPYFNWLSWVFAWMDTGKRRYAVYAIVYLAPYIRSNLSLSPEESWLPIASIALCIIHVQLEASIRSGDLDGFQFFNEAAERFFSFSKRENGSIEDHAEIDVKEKTQVHMKLPSSEEDLRDDFRKWKVPGKSFRDPEHQNKDIDAEEGKNH